MFSKEERSTFRYHFAHVFAFNMTALNLKVWKFKYLFHDWYKPWLRLFLPYEKVQRFHRTHSRHHLEWLEINPINKRALKFDWEAMLLDWECSRFTKKASQLTAYDEYLKQIEGYRIEAHKCFKEGNIDGENWNSWMMNKLTIYGQLYLNRLGLIKKESEKDSFIFYDFFLSIQLYNLQIYFYFLVLYSFHILYNFHMVIFLKY